MSLSTHPTTSSHKPVYCLLISPHEHVNPYSYIILVELDEHQFSKFSFFDLARTVVPVVNTYLYYWVIPTTITFFSVSHPISNIVLIPDLHVDWNQQVLMIINPLYAQDTDKDTYTSMLVEKQCSQGYLSISSKLFPFNEMGHDHLHFLFTAKLAHNSH